MLNSSNVHEVCSTPQKKKKEKKKMFETIDLNTQSRQFAETELAMQAPLTIGVSDKARNFLRNHKGLFK